MAVYEFPTSFAQRWMSTFAFDIAPAELLAPVLVDADGIPAGVKLRVTAGEPLFTREIA